MCDLIMEKFVMSRGRSYAAKPHGWIILLLFIILLEKQVIACLVIPNDASIRELGFGFGHYIRALLDGRGYINCPGESGHCEFISRMPVLPLLMALLGKLSDLQLTVAMIKNLLMSLLVWLALRPLLTPARQPVCGRWLVAVLLVFAASPPLLKHAAHVTYEEGLLIELLLIWMVWLLVRLRAGVAAPLVPPRQSDAVLVLVATLIFLTKSSMVLLWLGTLALVLAGLRERRAGRAASLVALLLSGLLVAAWAAHGWRHTGQLTLMSSFDGSNFLRSWNSTAARIYPEVSLDRVVDSPVITLADGSRVVNTTLPALPPVSSETDWQRAYLAAGRAWIAAHPAQALALLAVKAENFFLSVVKTPGAAWQGPQGIDGLITSLWLLAGRLMSLWLAWRLLRGPGPVWTRLLLFAALMAYAAPYVAGFNYERHITPFLYLVFVADLALRQGHAPARPRGVTSG